MSDDSFNYGPGDDYADAVAEAEDHWHAARDEYAARVSEWSGISFSDALHVLYSRLPGRP